MRKITILLTFLFLAGMQYAFAQDGTISGKVTSSEDGQGIPGVTVLVQGTTVGTTTDINGDYSLDSDPSYEILVFSYVGMTTVEISIAGQTVINVVMEPSALLMEEVVVTALGISREKKTLGYAVQELGGEEVNTVKTNNVVQSMSGKAAGVDVLQANTMGGSANIIVRGYTSLTQNNQAMFVIDGVPYDNRNTNEDRIVANSSVSNQNDGWGGYDYGNNAMDINPEDIESVSVLKGAAATALYGSRAANGVILITTKKGKLADRGKKRLGVTWSGGVEWGMADMTTTAEYQDQYGGGYGPFYDNENWEGVPDHFFFVGDLGTGNGDQLIVPTPEDASWGAKFDPNLTVVHWDALDPLKSNFGEERAWIDGGNHLDYFFQTGLKYLNTIAIDGANEFGSFRLSYTNSDETGIAVNSRFQRHNINFAGTYNVTKKFRVGANISYAKTNAYGRFGTGYDGMNPMQQLAQWTQANVDMKRLEESWLRADGSQLSWNSSYYDDLHPIYADNPYWTRNKNFEDDGRDRIFGYVFGEYDFTDYLSLNARFSGDVYSTYQNERIAVHSVDQSYYSNYTQNWSEYNTDLMLKFNKAWDAISVNAFVGGNFRWSTRSSILGQTVGGLVVPELYTVSNSVSPVRVTEFLEEKAVNAWFVSASIGFKNFIYLEGTFRSEYSSTFKPQEKDKLNYTYPSATLSFLLTELNGMNDISWLSLLKVRANYAEVGNDAPVHSTISTYTQNSGWGNYALFSVNSTLQNPALVPERTKGWEVGLEANFFKNRLRADVAYYSTDTYDQILPALVTPFSGVTRQWVNGGQVQNKGWEIALSGTPVQGKNFTWDIGVNWWKNTNEVIALFGDIENLLIYSAWDVSINASLGQPYGTIRGTDFIWTNDEKTVDENGYYMRTSTDTVIGNINPDWKMGIPTTFSFKGLSLYILVDIQKGGDIYSINNKYGEATGLYSNTVGNNALGNPMRDNLVSKDDGDLGPHFGGGLPIGDADPSSGGYVLPGVKEDGTENDILVNSGRWGRAFYYNNSPTARYVYDASYVKLREVALSYSLPSKVIENTLLNQVKFSVYGRNLWIIHKNTPNIDPEASLGSGNQQGIETGSYPSVRSIGFNVTLGF